MDTKPMRLPSNRKKELQMLRKDPILLLTILLIFAGLIIFVIFPFFNVFKTSIIDNNGHFSLQRFGEILSNRGYLRTLGNSVMLGAITAVISTFIGYVFAYATTRVKLFGMRFFRLMATLPIVSPPFILSLSMIFLFGRQGLITNKILGIRNFDIYGMGSLIIVQSMSFFPVAYLTLTGILSSIDSSVEDAAINMGASRWHVFKTVTFPLSKPGVLSSLLLVFIQSLEDFSNPAVIGGKFNTLAVEAYRLITGMYDMRGGAILAIMLLVPVLIAFLLQKYALEGKSYVTVTGKTQRQRQLQDDPKTKQILFVFCALISAFIILLYGTVFCGAFVKTWGVNFSFTLDHFRYILKLGFVAIKNSLILATIATPISGVLAMVIAFLVVRKRFPGRKSMEFLSMLMSAIPGTFVGIGYLLTFNSPPILLTGTAALIIIAFVFRNIPVGVESGISSLMQIDPSIEEASAILGASSFTTFKKITLPMIRQAFFSGLVYSFVRCMTAVSSVIFLISARWAVVTTKIFGMFEESRYSVAAAYILIMMAIILIAIAVINYLTTPHKRKTRYAATTSA